METVTPQPALPQDCLDKLSRVLDLVLKTAEAASADNNHKLVIQSAREATRIVALMHKMTSTKPASSRRGGQTEGKTAGPGVPVKPTASRPRPAAKPHPAAGTKGETDINPEDFLIPDLETLLSPQEMAFWQCLPDDYTEKARKEHRQIQALGKEALDFLLETDRKSGD